MPLLFVAALILASVVTAWTASASYQANLVDYTAQQIAVQLHTIAHAAQLWAETAPGDFQTMLPTQSSTAVLSVSQIPAAYIMSGIQTTTAYGRSIDLIATRDRLGRPTIYVRTNTGNETDDRIIRAANELGFAGNFYSFGRANPLTIPASLRSTNTLLIAGDAVSRTIYIQNEKSP